MRHLFNPLFVALLGLMGSNAAWGGTFHISPVRINLSGQAPIAVLAVRNESTESSVMQLSVMSWLQEGNDDIYTSTNEVLATPPIFTVPPGGTQIVRVGMRRKVEVRRELAYRLFIQEVALAGVDAKVGEVKLALRFGIPVFVAPANPHLPKPLLDWRVKVAPQNALRIEAMNQGDAHVQILGIALRPAADGAVLAEFRGMDYLLAKQGRSWLVSVKQVQIEGAPLTLDAQTDAGDAHAKVALEP
jgi:fimbrial chaperone protein